MKTKRVLWYLGKEAFFFVIIFVLIEIIIGQFLLYRYFFSAQSKEPEFTVDTSLYFKEDVYQSVLKDWQDREELFKQPSQENYPNPFFP